MLHPHPESAYVERATPGFAGETSLQELRERGMRAISPNGILGDPVGASASMGARGVRER